MGLKLKTNRKEIWIKRCKDKNSPESKKNPVVAEYKVFPATPSEVHEMFRNSEEESFYSMPTESKMKKKETVRELKVNSVKFTIERAKKCIRGWKGLTAENDEGVEVDIEYSEDMVETLYELNPEEINWVLEKIDEISSIIDKTEEEEIKN